MYYFGPFSLDSQRRALSRDGSLIPVTPKAFDILLYLVQHPNRVVSKQELMKAVWPDTVVEEGNLTQNISLLRKALGEHGDDRLIVTVARQGYQFTASVETETVTAVAPEVTANAATHRPAPWRRVAMSIGIAVVALIGISMAWQRFRASGVDPIRLAVLPFENLTGDPAQDYLADGLTEELITQLARLQPEQLGVIARTSVMRYKHTEKRMDEIGRDLSVRYALESSVRRSADRLRVTVQLIRVQDQSHVWANDFDYASQDILGIEDSVAHAVSRAVQLHVAAHAAYAAQLTRTKPEAVDDLLRGRDIVRYGQGTEDDWKHAKRYFEQAIAIDSTYALPWVWLSEVGRRGADRGFMPSDDGVRLAHEAAHRAVALDPALPDAYVQLGKIQDLLDWDWAGSDASYERALALDPENSDAAVALSGMAMHSGQFDRSIALARRAIALDPIDPSLHSQLGEVLYDAGRLTDAASVLEQDSAAIRSPVLDEKLVEIYLAQNRAIDAAIVSDRMSSPPWQGFARVLVAIHEGRQRMADSLTTDYVTHYRTFAAYQIAEMYAYRNQKDSAFAWLDRAYASRDEGMPDLKVDPLFVNLRSDARYTDWLKKMRLPP